MTVEEEPRDRRAVDREPHGFLPPPTPSPPGSRAPAGRLRRLLRWVFRDREDVDQEGLLAGRTLRIAQRRQKRDGEG